MNIELNKEPVYGDNDKYMKTKIKLYEDKVNTNFQGKKVPKENASYKCFSFIILGSVIRLSKKYYPQTLLEECKNEIKKNKMGNLINDNLDLIHLMMKLTMNLIMGLNLIMINNLLKFKTIF